MATLPASGSWSTFILVQATSPGAGTVNWNVSSATLDPNPGNNHTATTTNVVVPPPFSQGGAFPNPQACICLPPYMVQNPSSSHSWWARAAGSGALVISPYAVAVNALETGTLTVSVYDPSNVHVGTVTGAHPPSGEAPLPAIVVAAPVPGALYRITVSVGGGAPEGQQARHYRLKLGGATLLGMNSPTQSQAEHHEARWLLNVGAGELINVSVVPGPEAGATAATVRLYAPNGTLVASGGLGAVLGTTPAAFTGQYILDVAADGHYLVNKAGAGDHGVYADWQTGGEGAIDLTLTSGGGPNTTPVNVTVTDALTGDPTAQQLVTDHALFDKLPAGTYRVTINGPTGQITLTAVVTCEGIVLLTADLPPLIIPVTEGRMTGGGTIAVGNGKNAPKWTWGLEIRCDASHGTFEYQDHTGGNFHLEALGSVLCFDDPAIGPAPPQAGFDTMRMSGAGRWNGASGYTIEAEIVDAGEPGTNDRIKITVKNGAGGIVSTVSGRLTGGNQQAHR